MATTVRTPAKAESASAAREQLDALVVASPAGTPKERAERVRRATSHDLRAGVRITKKMYRPCP